MLTTKSGCDLSQKSIEGSDIDVDDPSRTQNRRNEAKRWSGFIFQGSPGPRQMVDGFDRRGKGPTRGRMEQNWVIRRIMGF
jgi:hypothetical protein